MHLLNGVDVYGELLTDETRSLSCDLVILLISYLLHAKDTLVKKKKKCTSFHNIVYFKRLNF